MIKTRFPYIKCKGCGDRKLWIQKEESKHYLMICPECEHSNRITKTRAIKELNKPRKIKKFIVRTHGSIEEIDSLFRETAIEEAEKRFQEYGLDDIYFVAREVKNGEKSKRNYSTRNK